MGGEAVVFGLFWIGRLWGGKQGLSVLEGQRGMGSSSRVDVSAPSILGYTGGDSSHTQDGQNAVGHQGCLGGKLWTQVLCRLLFCKPTGWEDDSVVCQTFLLVWATGFLPDGRYSRADTQVSCKMKLAAGQTDPCLEGLFSQLSFNPHPHLTGQNLEKDK